MKNKPEYIVIHSTAGPADRDIDDIRSVHIRLGWRDVGYHFIVTANGQVQRGRPVGDIGSHVRGLNDRSVGVCMVGTFDDEPPDEYQLYMTAHLCRALQQVLGIPAEKVIGHRETVPLVPAGQGTHKSCPGKAVDMDAFRARLLLSEGQVA